MPDQTFNLNLKAHDQGWEGKQVQIYNCAECGTDSSGAAQHSAWHDDLTNQLQQLAQAIQQEAQRAAAAEQQLQTAVQQAAALAQQALTLAQQAMAKP